MYHGPQRNCQGLARQVGAFTGLVQPRATVDLLRGAPLALVVVVVVVAVVAFAGGRWLVLAVAAWKSKARKGCGSHGTGSSLVLEERTWFVLVGGLVDNSSTKKVGREEECNHDVR